ncbi:MAG: ATP-dependent zinc metalloprotease FtsH [Parcubacteria group bacterium]|nr:ATP-dependent zinc metalloprotease FtsH [Parcubacteria group bacterium]
MKPNLLKNFITFIIIFLLISAIASSYKTKTNKASEIGWDTLVTRIENEEINKIIVEGNKITVTLKDNRVEKLLKEGEESISSILKNYNIDPEKLKKLNIQPKEKSGFSYWAAVLLPFLIPFFLIAFFLYMMMKQVQGANIRALSFGQINPREISKKKHLTTFKDVAGCDEAKEELQEVIEFLKNPKKFINLGAKIPKGVLLMGAPGTGKTLLAKAVAGEANVPFFSISGSEFVEMFVGVGASRVRDLFKKAKKNPPCIVFIDEIDAVGRQRGAGLGGSHDEREQTLNQILVEMDGFDTNTNVIIMAATNRPDVLDPALLRPGRFDRRIVLDLPDMKAREAILNVHAQNKPLSKEANLHTVAYRTPGFSGADLSNLLNEAAILAAKKNQKQITLNDILVSIEKVLLGPERKTYVLNPKEKEITAYHEAGHALVAHLLPHADPIQKVSIISRGRAAGYTLKMPEEDKKMHSRSEFIDDLAVTVAGHSAEKEIFKEVTTGAHNDLQKATWLARKLVTEYGMSDTLTPRAYGKHEEMIFLGREITEQKDYSEDTARLIDQEIDKLISQAFRTAKKLLTDNKDKLHGLAKSLVEQETLEKEQFEAIVGPKVSAA